MRTLVSSTALGLVLAAGASGAQAQTVDTAITQQPHSMIIAQAPVATVPAETVETVRTVRSTTTPRHRVVRSTSDRVTTTRTVVSRQIVPAAPAVTAITEPTYAAVMPPPPVAVAPGPRLYDVVTPAPVAAPATVVPSYRYVYEPDRILVIDPYTNIAVQSIPR